MNYYPWLHDDEDRSLAWITYAPDVLRDHPKEHQLSEGVSVKGWYPADVEMELSDQRGIKLADSVPNIMSLLIVSEKLKALMEERSGAQLEFLPVRLRDQKQRLVQKPYYVMNVLGTVECVDLERSKFRRSHIIPERIFRFFHLILDESKIPPDKKIFRLKEDPSLVIIREDLCEDILRAKVEGVMFLEMDEYGKEWGQR
ncbi:imm11 family protein [Archangium violaceum]|uniref:imm11 family protein n=1 Tax=Archangium violaceum TaxID=83451 RepID=UPI0036DEC0BE